MDEAVAQADARQPGPELDVTWVFSMIFRGSGGRRPGSVTGRTYPAIPGMSEPLSRYTVTRPPADTITCVVTITAPDPSHDRNQCPMR